MGIENPVHLLFIAAVALIVLGPKRLPDLAKALGHGIREFRDSLSEGEDEDPVTPPPAPAPAPAATSAGIRSAGTEASADAGPVAGEAIAGPETSTPADHAAG